MIRGFDNRGKEVYTFRNIDDMCRVLNLSKSAVYENFRTHKQYEVYDIIFHLDNSVGFEGHGIFTAPYGSVLVTPNDEIYDDTRAYYDAKDAADRQASWDKIDITLTEIENKNCSHGCLFNDALEEQAHAAEQQSFIDLKQQDEDLSKMLANQAKRDKLVKEAIKPRLLDKLKEEARDKLGGKDGGEYSANGSSEHYKKAILEYIDKQERAYGTFLAFGLSFMQVDKYRDRAGKKAGVPVEKEMTKANWYDTIASTYFNDKIALNNGDGSLTEDEFDEKYGAGRSVYINMPANLVYLLRGEFGFQFQHELKGLGDIVNEQQK